MPENNQEKQPNSKATVPGQQLRFEFLARSEEETAALGRALATVLPDRAIVGLFGTLGSGKTRLVQAVAEAVGVDRRDVISPTFVLINRYDGRVTIWHIDAYRIAGLDEFFDLGVEELFEAAGWVFIEWADRVLDALPRDRLDVEIEVVGDTQRRFVIRSHGQSFAEPIRRLQQLTAGHSDRQHGSSG